MAGALLMVASGVGFTAYLALAKLLSDDIHPLVLAFFRGFVSLAIIAPVIWRVGWSGLAPKRPWLIGLRSLFGSLGFGLSLIAVSDLFALPLSQFNAISFSRPLFVTLMAALILREVVGPRRWGAVAMGFVGVVIMSAPSAIPVLGDLAASDANAAFDLASALALASAIAFAGAIILVKALSADHSSTALLVWANILSTVMLAPAAWAYWTPPGLFDWGLIVLMSFSGLGAQFCYIKAMSMGDASFLSPMDYLRLPMAAIADWLFFKLLPGLHVWLGAAVIVAATLYIAVRERRIRTRPAPTDDPS